MYCFLNQDSGKYELFFRKKTQLLMCGVREENIKKVKVEETSGETGYWGLKDIIKNEYRFIFGTIRQVEMCSPDFYKSDIKKGKVKIVPMQIFELEN